MPYQTKLPAALIKFGLQVKLVPGWQTRGSSAFNPKGSVGHHTAGPKTGDHPSLKVCIDGRPGLRGPLCNTFLPRGLTVEQRVVYVVAAGRANHAGLGGFRGLVGNSSVFGTEAEDDGIDGIWTDWQLWAFPRVQAAQLWIAGRDESWYCSHRTWAPTRKTDPKGIADVWMRDKVHDIFHPPVKKPTPKPSIPQVKETDMAMADADMDKIATKVWTTKPATVGQQTGGALHELDLRTASTEQRLGPIEEDLAKVKDLSASNAELIKATADNVDQILKLLTPAPVVTPEGQATP